MSDATRIRLELEPVEKILLRRRLNEDGEAQKHFTKLVEKAMNPYVPYLTGNLKDAKRKIYPRSIHYNAEYAEIQYYTNVGMGREGTRKGGLRGAYFDKRAWAAHGKDIIGKMAKFVGGKTK